MHEEIELKLQAPPAALRSIVGSGFVRAIGADRPGKQHLVSTYFDTPRHTLRKDGLALRIRKLSDGFEQSVKAPVAGVAGLQTYREWNSRVPRGAPVIAAVDDRNVRSRLTLGARHKRLIPLFKTDVERHSVPVRYGGSVIELSLDIGRIEAAGGGSEAVSELELELLEGKPSAVLELALKLLELADLDLGHLTKAERGYLLARRSLRRNGFKADPIDFGSKIAAPSLFQAVMNGTLNHLRANERPAAAGHSEGVHQARVAIRRLRAALWVFRHVVPEEDRKAFNREFRWFQGQLAPARDWHVFLDETVPALSTANPGGRATAAWLRRGARQQVARVTDDIAGLFRGARYTRLILRFTLWLSEQGASMKQSLSVEPVTGFAAGMLDGTHARVLYDLRPLSRMSAANRHTLRKRSKKLRYACEFFSSLWPGRRSSSYLHSMKCLQGALGEINDVRMAGRLIDSLDPDGAESRHAERVREWSAARLARCLRETQPLWRQFQRQEPFWRPAAQG